MTSPHHSIIRRLVSTGQGAAAWTMERSDDTSAAARTSSGSWSRRLNMVGTMWEVVTRRRSMSSSAPSAVQRSMSTAVWPMCSDMVVQLLTAVWYIGAWVRWTLSSWGAMANSMSSPPERAAASSGWRESRARRTPLGRPVVPEV